MIPIKTGISIIILLCSFLWIECVNDVAGGIGHEGEAKIFGKVVYADSDSIPVGASVFINTDNYIHPFNKLQEVLTPDAIVDDSGYFFIKAYLEGKYTIEINDGNKNAVVIRCEISHGDTSVVLMADTLRSTGMIHGKIIDSANSESQMYLHVKGLERIAVLDTETSTFTFYDVPAGSFEIAASLDTLSNAPINFGSVVVKPTDTLFVNYKYASDSTVKPVSKMVSLNTSSSGAGIENDIYDFPLLIRLDQNNFNFTYVENSGKGIYFTKVNGEFLPFEIESWNSVEKNAAVWVLIDTIHGNSTTQSIIMNWGENVSVSKENGRAVFDTSKGFQGVWHFSQLQADTLADATANNFYGIPNAILTDVPGQIGYAKSFNGFSDFVKMPTTDSSTLIFSEKGTYSLSAWIFIKNIDTLYQSIVTKGNRIYGLQLNDSAELEFYEYSEETAWNLSRTPVNAGTWHYCTGVRNGELQYLYMDGICVDSIITTLGNLRGRVTNESLCIGNRVSSAETGFFNGYIDEVRIHNKVLNSDWIKLSYVNQSDKSDFVNIR